MIGVDRGVVEESYNQAVRLVFGSRGEDFLNRRDRLKWDRLEREKRITIDQAGQVLSQPPSLALRESLEKDFGYSLSVEVENESTDSSA